MRVATGSAIQPDIARYVCILDSGASKNKHKVWSRVCAGFTIH